jgi:hypothetical protein
MKIELKIDFNKTQEQIPVIKDFLPQIKKVGMYYYWPFDNSTDTATKQMIESDINDPVFLSKFQQLCSAWSNLETEITVAIKEIVAKQNDVELLDSYQCYILPYGCYGYYNPPNEIFINIRDAEINHILETIIHELLHLIFIKQVNKKSHHELEQFIDDFFTSKELQKIFPNYKH